MPNVYVVVPILFSDITVRFGEATYSFNEVTGHAQPVLVLSNPSSTDITVEVRDNANTATSE